jgi:hypothetical protein
VAASRARRRGAPSCEGGATASAVDARQAGVGIAGPGERVRHLDVEVEKESDELAVVVGDVRQPPLAQSLRLRVVPHLVRRAGDDCDGLRPPDEAAGFVRLEQGQEGQLDAGVAATRSRGRSGLQPWPERNSPGVPTPRQRRCNCAPHRPVGRMRLGGSLLRLSAATAGTFRPPDAWMQIPAVCRFLSSRRASRSRQVRSEMGRRSPQSWLFLC